MADNVTLNAGTGGDVIAADDVGGAKYQYVKLVWGPDNTINLADAAAGKAIPVAPLPSGTITLESRTSGITNATNTRTITTGLDAYSELDILILLTTAGAATGTLQLFLQDSRDGGTTWDDLVSSPTYTFGAGARDYNFAISGKLATTRPQGQASQLETLAAGSVRQGPFGSQIRVREKVSGIAGGPTGVAYTITAVAKR